MNAKHTGSKTEFNVHWPFTVIQGHVFRSQWKASQGLLSHNNFGLISKDSEDIATEITENRSFRPPL